MTKKKKNSFNALSKKYGTGSIKKLFNFINGSTSKNSTKLKETRILSNKIKEETKKGRSWSKNYKKEVLPQVNKKKQDLNVSVRKTKTLRKGYREKLGVESKKPHDIYKAGLRKNALKNAQENLEYRKTISAFNKRGTMAQVVSKIKENGKEKTVSMSLNKQQWHFIKNNKDTNKVLNYLESTYSDDVKERYEDIKNNPEINIIQIEGVRTLF